MKRNKRTEKKTVTAFNSDPDISSSVRKSNEAFLPIFAEDGRVVGLVTDRDICNTVATKKIDFELITRPQFTSGRIIPCMTDKELRAALKTLLPLPEVHVTVEGGIVRHGFR